MKEVISGLYEVIEALKKPEQLRESVEGDSQ